MKKIIFCLFSFIFSSNFLFAQQKDTLVLVVGKNPDKYSIRPSDFFATLEKALENVVQTTPERFFLDNAGIKSEFLKCYFDTSIIKTIADKDIVIAMIKEKYVKQQADF
jgi:hypothetical protein